MHSELHGAVGAPAACPSSAMIGWLMIHDLKVFLTFTLGRVVRALLKAVLGVFGIIVFSVDTVIAAI